MKGRGADARKGGGGGDGGSAQGLGTSPPRPRLLEKQQQQQNEVQKVKKWTAAAAVMGYKWRQAGIGVCERACMFQGLLGLTHTAAVAWLLLLLRLLLQPLLLCCLCCYSPPPPLAHALPCLSMKQRQGLLDADTACKRQATAAMVCLQTSVSHPQRSGMVQATLGENRSSSRAMCGYSTGSNMGVSQYWGCLLVLLALRAVTGTGYLVS